MLLASGQFFGKSEHEIEVEGLHLSSREYGPFEQQPWHSHEHPTIFITLSGDQLDETQIGEWCMPAMSATYHSTSLKHRSRIGPAGAYGVNIEISQDWLASTGLDGRQMGRARTVATEAARWAALRIFRLYAPLAEPHPNIRDMVLELLSVFDSESITSEATDPTWLRRIEERIALEYREAIGLATLAVDAGVHPVHLARVFRRKHGISITDYLQRLRVESAAKQIVAGDSIGSAALDAGFADQFHFTRTFKAHFGYCPKYLKSLRCCNRS